MDGARPMTLTTLFFLALGLSMDAFAVSISNGICYRNYTKAQILSTAFAFGGFQGLMPILGYLAGSTVSHLIEGIDHYIALILLGYLGGRMIWEAATQMRHPEVDCPVEGFTYPRLLIQAVATSIDALAVGVTLAALDVNIVAAALFICCITFVCSLLGVGLGRRFGIALKARAEIFGGAILVLIGLKIFLEHTFGG